MAVCESERRMWHLEVNCVGCMEDRRVSRGRQASGGGGGGGGGGDL
jgi:hypothetical protein